MSDTYCSFSNVSRADVLQTIEKIKKMGREQDPDTATLGWKWSLDPMSEHHNSSPSIEELLALAEEYGNRIRYIGYTITPPRTDWRLSLDGFTGTLLSADEALDLMSRYSGADEASHSKTRNGYSVRFWWD